MCRTHFLVLSFFSRALACCSLMMVAFTCGGFMCTLSFPPTSRRTVVANLVCVFNTCGGCFSMMNVLRTQRHEKQNDIVSNRPLTLNGEGSKTAERV